MQCKPRSRAAASGFWLPPIGPIKDFHLRSFIHAQRTSSRYARLGQAPTGDLQKRRYTNDEDHASRMSRETCPELLVGVLEVDPSILQINLLKDLPPFEILLVGRRAAEFVGRLRWTAGLENTITVVIEEIRISVAGARSSARELLRVRWRGGRRSGRADAGGRSPSAGYRRRSGCRWSNGIWRRDGRRPR